MKARDSSLKTAHYLSVLVALILALLPFHALLTTWVGSNIGHLDRVRIWKEVLIVLMAPFVGLMIIRTPELKSWFFKSKLAWLIRFYILLHLILGWYALAHHELDATAFIYSLIINLRFLAFFVICYVLASRSTFLKQYWQKILLIPASIVIIFGLLQQFVLPYDFLKHFGYGPKTIPPYQAVDANIDYSRIQSSLRGANPLGAYLIVIILAILTWPKRRISYWAPALLLSFIVMFFSYSRSAWLGLIIAFCALGAILAKRVARKGALTIAITLLMGVGLIFSFRSSQSIQDVLLHTSSHSKSAVSSNDIRNRAIKNGLNDVYHQPLGRGPGTAGPASFRNLGHAARISENYYLQIGQEVGVVGLALFLAINALIAKELWLRRKDVLAQILLASLVGISFVNLVSHAWTDDTLSLIWWGLAGICLAPVIITDRTKVKNAKTKAKTA